MIQALYGVGPFQSTLPARGATFSLQKFSFPATHFNPRSLHGERRSKSALPSTSSDFNPRSLHGERQCNNPRPAPGRLFQSTLPARGATCRVPQESRLQGDFNPRSLHGERPGRAHSRPSLSGFQSTLPARGATRITARYIQRARRISIHAPCTGSDSAVNYDGVRVDLFQSTLPARGATAVGKHGTAGRINFNPRSLHGERRNSGS